MITVLIPAIHIPNQRKKIDPSLSPFCNAVQAQCTLQSHTYCVICPAAMCLTSNLSSTQVFLLGMTQKGGR